MGQRGACGWDRFALVIASMALLGAACGGSEFIATRDDASAETDVAAELTAEDTASHEDAGDEGGTGDSSVEATSVEEASGDVDVHDGAADAELTSPEAALCTATGGVVETKLCCDSFAEGCGRVDPCSRCSTPARMVPSCHCPQLQCYSRQRGCNTAVCSGGGGSCNDNPILSSIKGVCTPEGTCTCATGATLNPDTGKCR